MLIPEYILAVSCVVVQGLNEASFEATNCKIDLTCNEGVNIQSGIPSSLKTVQGRPGKQGPVGPKGSKGEKGDDCRCSLRDRKEVTQLKKQLEDSTKRVCPQFKYHFPSVAQTSDYIRVKVPLRRITMVTICAWVTPLPGKTVENGFFSYAIPGQDNALLLWFKNGKFIPHLLGATRDFELIIRKREHICMTLNKVSTEIYVNGTFRSTLTFHNMKPIEGGGALIIGQEQDSVLGGFHPSQAFTGTVENLMLWYRVLSEKEIFEMRMNPCHCPKDYDVAFSPEFVQMNGGVLAKPVDSCEAVTK